MNNPETSRGAPTIGRNESVSKPPTSPPRQAAQLKIDDSKTAADYANFCRLSGAPEELVIDFGLNPHPTGTSTHPVVVEQRIVLGWHTAKRLLQTLQLAVDRHEAAFGVLETDVQKRVGRS